MTTLIIDSSHKYLAVGIVQNDKIIANKQAILKQQQSEYLISYIKDVLEMANVDKKNIHNIVLTDGPGSYTGMRISMAFAKVFALTHKINVYTINTLYSISGLNDGFLFLDARSKRVFGAFKENGELKDQKIYQLDEVKELDVDLIGDVELLNMQEQAINVVKNILVNKNKWVKVENIDLLSPKYQ
ncbi:MAG TPA: tRNA (adenosine(37)-N6)-threonylcarbamoyltransferase complex dimerization subunit type 1 TsaB [Erysipelothrix sp.]|nr:tRNA (adenosine(37)-N6)-threonylcarbamoyltransferase complex dimerization subunit type 1 TsaB [Erysipelothrix sp.]